MAPTRSFLLPLSHRPSSSLSENLPFTAWFSLEIN
jgi:hypothetical protein